MLKKEILKSTCRQVKHDKNGRFPKGVSGNPKGNNQFTSIVPLLEALERKGVERNESFWDMVADKCWKRDQILIAVLKKIVPDKVEHDISDNLVEKFKDISVTDLLTKANVLIGKTNKPQ